MTKMSIAIRTVVMFVMNRKSVLQQRTARMVPRPMPMSWRGNEAEEMDSEAVQMMNAP